VASDTDGVVLGVVCREGVLEGMEVSEDKEAREASEDKAAYFLRMVGMANFRCCHLLA